MKRIHFDRPQTIHQLRVNLMTDEEQEAMAEHLWKNLVHHWTVTEPREERKKKR